MLRSGKLRERRARPQLALHPDPAPVQLDELPTEGQPQPRALHLLVRRPDLPELLEDGLLILRGDADAGVADRDLYETVFWIGPDLDAPTLRREIDRIRQQVRVLRMMLHRLWSAETCARRLTSSTRLLGGRAGS